MYTPHAGCKQQSAKRKAKTKIHQTTEGECSAMPVSYNMEGDFGVIVIVWSDELWDMTEEEKQTSEESEDVTPSRTHQ
jgi:hypothetical protein